MSLSNALDALVRGRRAPVRGVRWRMRRRSDWALFILLLLGLGVLVTLLVTQVWTPLALAPDAGSEGSAVFTAGAARDAAAPLAEQWAGDAALVRLRATWDRALDYQPGSGEWTLLYYSRRRAETALVAVVDGRATLAQVSPAEQPLAVGPATWQMDSPDAAEAVFSQGGRTFLRRHPEALLTLTLSLEAPAVWQGALINRASRQTFVVELDAEDGEVLTIQQSQ